MQSFVSYESVSIKGAARTADQLHVDKLRSRLYPMRKWNVTTKGAANTANHLYIDKLCSSSVFYGDFITNELPTPPTIFMSISCAVVCILREGHYNSDTHTTDHLYVVRL